MFISKLLSYTKKKRTLWVVILVFALTISYLLVNYINSSSEKPGVKTFAGVENYKYPEHPDPFQIVIWEFNRNESIGIARELQIYSEANRYRITYTSDDFGYIEVPYDQGYVDSIYSLVVSAKLFDQDIIPTQQAVVLRSDITPVNQYGDKFLECPDYYFDVDIVINDQSRNYRVCKDYYSKDVVQSINEIFNVTNRHLLASATNNYYDNTSLDQIDYEDFLFTNTARPVLPFGSVQSYTISDTGSVIISGGMLATSIGYHRKMFSFIIEPKDIYLIRDKVDDFVSAIELDGLNDYPDGYWENPSIFDAPSPYNMPNILVFNSNGLAYEYNIAEKQLEDSHKYLLREIEDTLFDSIRKNYNVTSVSREDANELIQDDETLAHSLFFLTQYYTRLTGINVQAISQTSSDIYFITPKDSFNTLELFGFRETSETDGLSHAFIHYSDYVVY